ncbi:MAG: 2-oxoacid:acceptor oxidoreductase family protein [Rhodospirillales bacterium]|jgi:2-oxoglutarate ferredoxin oxidoreductase subunit gamma|nr:2-oxoacid:acceptor oxidoreductase family protein [Rhodospirillales bacterium]
MTGETGRVGGDRQIRFSGSGGQGLQLSARILAEAALHDGWSVAHSQGYEPTSRGGLSRSDLVLSRGVIDYPLVTSLDVLVILDDVGATASTSLLTHRSLVIVDAERVTEPPLGPWTVQRLACTATARRLGNERTANVVCLGALLALTPVCTVDSLTAALRDEVSAKLIDLNLEALAAGRALISQTAGVATPAAAPAAP